MAEKTLLDLEAMANDNLDDIPEAPDFVIPPAGEYCLRVKESKIDKYTSKDEPDVEKQRLKNIYEVVETISTVNEPPVPNGSMFSETFQGTEEGLGYFKKRIKKILNVENTAGVSLADMMSSVLGYEFDCRITIKKSANPAGGFYENVNIMVVPPK